MNDKGRMYVNKIVLNVTESSIDFLVSSGFIIVQENKVLFSHQSLLDYFLAEYMYKKYNNGENIEEIIGNKNEQTPARRYQLQMLLENVLQDSEEDFIELGLSLMKSDSVRYYNKFVFLELLGQLEVVSYVVENFIVSNILNNKWKRYLIDNVVLGNRNYYVILRKNGIIKDLIDTDIDLFISILISIKPNFDTDDVKIIEEYSKNKNVNINVLSRLFSLDLSEDNDEMFRLRLKLCEKFPEMLSDYIDYKKSIKNNSYRAIKYLELQLKHRIEITRHYDMFNFDINFLEEDHIFLENNQKIIMTLLKHLPTIEIKSKYSKWSSFSSGKSKERITVDILKKANKILIRNNHQLFFKYYKDFMDKGYDIHNEIILDAFLYLPKNESNRIINSIIDNFEINIFDYTSGSPNKLDLVKKCLEKHSLLCDVETYKLLEKKILRYVSPQAKSIYIQRIERNRDNGPNVYWSFWGDLQYELLRVLPKERLSEYSWNLIKVLQRKFQNSDTIYEDCSDHSGSIMSPVTNKKLSPKVWMDIACNSNIKNRKNNNWIQVPNGFIESSVEQFSTDFMSEVSNNPLKYIELILAESRSIGEGFINAFFSGISNSEYLLEIDPQLIEKVILLFSRRLKSNAYFSISTVIKRVENFEWDQEILDLLKLIILTDKEGKSNDPTVTSQTDKEMKSYEMLYANAINNVVGNASEAIGSLIWDKPDLFYQFKDIIVYLSEHDNPAIRLSVMFILIPSFNKDKSWTSNILIKLWNKDYRILGFQESRTLLHSIYKNEKQIVLDLILRCYHSKDNHLKKIGSHCISEFYILYNEFNDVILDLDDMDIIQLREIINLSLLYFNLDAHNEKIKLIVNTLSENKNKERINISRLFKNNIINLERDKDFLISIMKSGVTNQSADDFIRYIFNSNYPVYYYEEIVINLCDELIYSLRTEDIHDYQKEDILGRLTIKLYDEATRNITISPQMRNLAMKSLDIWDNLFEYQVSSVRQLTKEMLNR